VRLAGNMADKPLVTDRASLELLYDISREFAAALDLRTVLHRVVFLSMKTVGAVSGSIIVLDDKGMPVDSAFLLRGQSHNQNTLQLRLTYEQGLAGWVGRHRQAVLISDTSQDERWLQRPDDSLDRTGPKSAVSAPILTRDQLVGVVTLVHPKPGFFTQDHLELVQAVADQAGVAIINARLYAESQRQAQVMTAVAESATVITASLKLDDVLQRILEQINQALGVQGTFLALIDPEKSDLEVRAAIPRTELDNIGIRIPLGMGIAGWVAKGGQGAIVQDVRFDSRFQPEVDQILGFECQSIISAPIRSEGQVIGILEILNPRRGSFDTDDLLVLMGIASLAGTAIRHAQLYESLQAAHKRYQELFEDSIDLILITDWKGKVLEANRQAEATLGLKNEQIRSMAIGNLHKVDYVKVGQRFERLTSGEMISYESSLLAYLSGQIVPVQVYVCKIYSDGVSQLQWIMRDISERKNLDRLREDMTAMIYHDLRSPLANIVSSLEIMSSQESLEKDSSLFALLKIALRSTERIQRLTESLLDINRLEAGQVISNLHPVSLFSLVEESIDVVLPTVKSKEIELLVQVSPDLPYVLVDADMIRRVLINLFENAIKFTPLKEKIWVNGWLEAGFVQLSVKDSGPGIASADQDRIFEKFTRLEQANGLRGLGLGLAFCRLAVTGHGGRIWVESEMGKGSSFIFTLPVAPKTKQNEQIN
jgi:NtrC-family two-component system sensor histidine kinase KinB